METFVLQIDLDSLHLDFVYNYFYDFVHGRPYVEIIDVFDKIGSIFAEGCVVKHVVNKVVYELGCRYNFFAANLEACVDFFQEFYYWAKSWIFIWMVYDLLQAWNQGLKLVSLANYWIERVYKLMGYCCVDQS